VLLFGLLYHGLNGVRVMLVGTGFVTDRQRALWWAGAAIGTIVLVEGASHFLGGR
jgi:succinate dehydrogenase/fumarate reductase cytochrome b subunit